MDFRKLKLIIYILHYFNMNKKTTIRVICPNCNGWKIACYYNEEEDCNEWGECKSCEGQGIMEEITTVEYKSLTDAT